ncbi:ROK family transcriptional regulator [Ectobacillus ponti]|uniref:ROK family protein n=1 Tax=Ectobacillus ponti TaxID=2961894 RepID=A0AA41XEA0_9BACI|nr:ROK family protein [Ectobacillus ponti]MCP8970516.1 ROK family protein [Ectobacillus ponti]
MITGDAAYIKRMNRASIISKIIEYGSISRAELAKVTGLNKATISVQAADLLEEGILIETQPVHGGLGRRPIMLSIHRKAGYVLGVDLDENTATFALADLTASLLEVRSVQLKNASYPSVLQSLIDDVKAYQAKCDSSQYGLVAVVIGIHGTVSKDETVRFVPKYQWRNKPLKLDVEAAVGIPVYIENNANLCALAEMVYCDPQSQNLLSVSLYSGIGLGMMIDGKLLRGHHGYAGEIGHMIVVPDGRPCSCGNLGCWEQYASEHSFIKQLQSLKPDVSPVRIQEWLRTKEAGTHQHMQELLRFLSIGLNNLINVYNPEVIVINSELLGFYAGAIPEIQANLSSTISHYQELRLSTLGREACMKGACAFAIQRFLGIAELNLSA